MCEWPVTGRVTVSWALHEPVSFPLLVLCGPLDGRQVLYSSLSYHTASAHDYCITC